MQILSVKNIDKLFYSAESRSTVHAVNRVNFTISEGEFVGLVGESGCGKSTIAKIISGLLKPDDGAVLLSGRALQYPFPRAAYKNLQIIFQLPQDSFDPRRTIGESITQCQRNFNIPKDIAKERTISLLKRVGLGEEFYQRYPHQMSGGECQRSAIARAISVAPKLLICDEITSALDVSTQAQIIELLGQLRKEYGLSALFISHDLALVQSICEKLLVMYGGQIVEHGTTDEVLTNPQNPYTKLLLDCVLEVEPV